MERVRGGAPIARQVAAKQQNEVIAAKLDKEEEEDDDDDDDDEDDLLPEAQPSQTRNEVLTGMARGRLRENAVHVYGLDFLKTEHMNEIFSQLNHKFVEWINDSSANIMFADAATAKKALESLSFPKTGDEPWRRTPDILVSEDVPPIFLQMRFAMTTDVKPSKKSVPNAAPMQQLSSAPPRGKGQFGGKRKRMYADEQMSKDEALEVLGGEKKPKKTIKPTEAERLLREKRAARFGEIKPVSETTLAKSAAERNAPLEHIEATDDEIARRRKRDGRFAAPAPGEAKSIGRTAAVAPVADAKTAETAKPTGGSATTDGKTISRVDAAASEEAQASAETPADKSFVSANSSAATAPAAATEKQDS